MMSRETADVTTLGDAALATFVGELLDAIGSLRAEIDRLNENVERREGTLSTSLERLREAQDELNKRCAVAREA